MHPDIRRIIAVEAHRRRTGHCPTNDPCARHRRDLRHRACHGFTDLASGQRVRCEASALVLGDDNRAIATGFTDDIGFSGFDPHSGEHFHGRAGGGATVTIYDACMVEYFQYALAEER